MDILPISEAEKIAAKRLDRRRKWFVWHGEVCFESKWTEPCSGCSCDTEYPCSCCTKAGGGCQECGYTGKRVQSFPTPHWTLEWTKKSRREWVR